MSDDSWRTQAACIGLPLDMFYAEPNAKRGRPTNDEDAVTEDYYAAAREVCGRCQVRQPCLDFALQHDVDRGHGMYGGLTPGERWTLRRRRQRRNRRAA